MAVNSSKYYAHCDLGEDSRVCLKDEYPDYINAAFIHVTLVVFELTSMYYRAIVRVEHSL